MDDGNVIGGNLDHGIEFERVNNVRMDNDVTGNLIGLNAVNASGTWTIHAVGNGGAGIHLANAVGGEIEAAKFKIGGISAENCNVIGLNDGNGISLFSTAYIDIECNLIGRICGPQFPGLDSNIYNGDSGIYSFNGRINRYGYQFDATCSFGGANCLVISTIDQPAIELQSGNDSQVFRNSYLSSISAEGIVKYGLVRHVQSTVGDLFQPARITHGSAVLPIDLNWDGMTPNDPGDGVTGVNNLLNYPEAFTISDNAFVSGDACVGCTVDVYDVSTVGTATYLETVLAGDSSAAEPGRWDTNLTAYGLTQSQVAFTASFDVDTSEMSPAGGHGPTAVTLQSNTTTTSSLPIFYAILLLVMTVGVIKRSRS